MLTVSLKARTFGTKSLKIIANWRLEPLEPEVQKPSLNARTFGTGGLKAIANWKLELLELKVQKSSLTASPKQNIFGLRASLKIHLTVAYDKATQD